MIFAMSFWKPSITIKAADILDQYREFKYLVNLHFVNKL